MKHARLCCLLFASTLVGGISVGPQAYAFPGTASGSRTVRADVETISFWGRPYPYGYAWGAPYTFGARRGRCGYHGVRVETPTGLRWHYVRVCR